MRGRRTPTRSDDLQILEMLHMRDGEGQTLQHIANQFGVSRSSIAGMLHRVDINEAPCACFKPENQDGALGPRWWA